MDEREMSGRAPLRSIVIVGGGTAGWSAAALLAQRLRGTGTSIRLIESSAIPTVGVGEATIPPIFEFLRACAIDELEFIRRTSATMKLAIEFRDWTRPGERYWHPFGAFGMTINERPFHHFWWRLLAEGKVASVADFSPSIALAEARKFAFPSPDGSYPGAGLAFAMHFDAGLVAAFLREVAEAAGVERLDRTVIDVETGPSGIAALTTDRGERIVGDLFLDCSGFRGLLIGQALKAGYTDWRHWLPCDRAVAMPSSGGAARTPYTVATARPAGWQWRIPLQQRVGNGYVYSSDHCSDAAAVDELVRGLDAEPLAEPRLLRFVPGHRDRAWMGNCVAIGLSAGFLEPLESTSIHLIHTGLNRLFDYWPDRTMSPALQSAYNREVADEYAHIRDFLLLHYVPNRREGEPFWDRMRAIELPPSLREKIALFEAAGRIVSRRRELFGDLSWWFVAVGMGLKPDRHDPLVDAPPPADLWPLADRLAETMHRYRDAAPSHDSILERLLDRGEIRRPNFSTTASGFGR